MLQHGDSFAHPAVAEPNVSRVGFAADEELRDHSACFSVELHPSLGENLCP